MKSDKSIVSRAISQLCIALPQRPKHIDKGEAMGKDILPRTKWRKIKIIHSIILSGSSQNRKKKDISKSSKRVNAEDESKEMVDQRHIKLKQGNFSANGLEPAISRRPPKYINQLRIQSMDFLATNQTNPPRDLWQGSNEHHVTQPIYMKRKSKCEKQSSKYAKIESKERYKKE